MFPALAGAGKNTKNVMVRNIKNYSERRGNALKSRSNNLLVHAG
jgi:hypothetical protein